MPKYYPERPTANGWQFLGDALQQGGNVVHGLDLNLQEQSKNTNLLQDMVERRMARLQEQQQQAAEEKRKETEFTQSKEKYKRDKDEADRKTKADAEFRKYAEGSQQVSKPAGQIPYAAPGLGPNGEAQMEVPAEYVTQPRTREELAQRALATGVLSPDKYLDDTKPATGLGLNDRIALATVQAGLKPPPAPKGWQVTEVNGRKVQVNPDTGEQRDLGAVTVRLNPKDKTVAKVKLQSLSLAKQQLDNIQTKFNAIKNSMSAGPLQGKLPTPSGKEFDAALDAFRDTKTALTRVPGVGAQSDFETKLTQASLPTRNEYEDVTQQKIDQLYQLVSTLESGYAGMLENQGEEDPAAGGTQPPPAPAPGPTALTAEDRKAILWAKKNPSNPKALEILRTHGM